MRPVRVTQTANERCLLQTVKKLDAERAENIDLRVKVKAMAAELAAAYATIEGLNRSVSSGAPV